jgi:hypothetical protein
MEETVTAFPFRKLINDIYLILDVMMHVDRSDVLQYLFEVNKETRSFLQKHFIAIKNGFINEGLIVYDINGDY